jgi:hypothetical protein
MLRRVALVRTDVSEELTASIIRVHRLLVTANVIPNSPILITLMIKALGSSETSVLTKAALHSNPEDGILHSHRRERLKSYPRMETIGLKQCATVKPFVSALRNRLSWSF